MRRLSLLFGLALVLALTMSAGTAAGKKNRNNSPPTPANFFESFTAEPVITDSAFVVSQVGQPIFQTGQDVEVILTVVVKDSLPAGNEFNPDSARVLRFDEDRRKPKFKLYDDTVVFLPTGAPRTWAGTTNFNEPNPANVTILIEAAFSKKVNKVRSDPFTMEALTTVEASSTEDQTIFDPVSGCALTVPKGSQRGTARLGCVNGKGVTTPPGVISAADLELFCVALAAVDQTPIGAGDPLGLSFPPTGSFVSGAAFDIVTEVLADSPGGGLKLGLLTLETGILNDEGQVVTGKGLLGQRILSGLLCPDGDVSALPVTGSGWVTGTVKDDFGNPRAGVWVFNEEESLLRGFFSDTQGRYIVRVDTFYRVKALDGSRCAKGQSIGDGMRTRLTGRSGTVRTPVEDPALAIVLNADTPRTRDGFGNPDLEAGSLTRCWDETNVQVVQRGATGAQAYKDLFGLGITIEPTGDWMAAIEPPATTLTQEILFPDIPSGDPFELKFDFNFGCRSAVTCPTAPASSIGVTAELLNSSDTVIASYGGAKRFHASFNGQISWKTGTIIVPTTGANAVSPGDTVKLKFTLISDDDAAVLIDNVRFHDVPVVANFVEDTPVGGSPSPITEPERQQAEQQIDDANEFLAQTGSMLFLRRIARLDQNNSVCNPPSGVATAVDLVGDGTDVSYSQAERTVSPDGVDRIRGVRTAEERALLCLGPENHPDLPDSVVHLYFVPTVLNGGTSAFGWSVSRADYHGEERTSAPVGFVRLNYNSGDPTTTPDTANLPFNQSGIILSIDQLSVDPDRLKYTLPHEIGHNLMDRLLANDLLEHRSPVSNVMSTGDIVCEPVLTPALPGGFTFCSGRPILSRPQSDEFLDPTPPARATTCDLC